MTAQYGRLVSVVVGSDTKGIDFAGFRVAFKIRRGDVQTPNSADVRIYNVNPSTAAEIATAPEFTRLVIEAGYPGNYGLIFDGQIKQIRRGRESQTDTYVDITAADGDEPYNFSALAMSLALGSTPTNTLDTLVKAMATNGLVRAGYKPDLPNGGAPRGRVLYGMTRDELRDFAQVNDCNWSIQNGELVLIPNTSFVPGEVPVISPGTGLIGNPEQTPSGVNIRTLLNPSIKIGERIKLDGTIDLYRYPLGHESQIPNSNFELASRTAADGVYYVMSVEHSGDTRDDEWYSDLRALAVNPSVPADAASQAVVQPDAASIRRD